MGSEKGLKKFLKSKVFSLLIVLAAMVVIFTVWSALIGNSFFTMDTLVSIVDLLVVTSFLAIGAGCLMISGYIDLSASSIGALAGVMIAAMMKFWAMPWPLALLLTLVICGAFGVFNAVLVNEFNFQPFIATMAMASVINGVKMFVGIDPATKSSANINFSNGFTDFLGSYKIGGIIPVTIVLMLVAFIVYGVMLSKTKFGMSIYLVGGNPVAARLSGLNPKRISYILFTNSAVLAAVSGIVLMARTKQGALGALSSAMFTGLTAAMLGGISFGGGSGGMGGVFIGLLILNTFSKGMAIVKFDAYWTSVLMGVVLIAALSFDYSSTMRMRKAVYKQAVGPGKSEDKDKEKVANGH